jgi:hypothetical protein
MIDLATYRPRGDKRNTAFFEEFLPRVYARRAASGLEQVVGPMAAIVIQVDYGNGLPYLAELALTSPYRYQECWINATHRNYLLKGGEAFPRLIVLEPLFDDFEDEVGAFEFGLGALDADAFDVVEAFAEAGGVDEAKGDAVDLDDFFDGVAGGSGGGADDGAFEAEEAVEEAAFANVGFANDDGAGAVSEDAALFGRIEQGAGAGEELIEAGLEGGAGVGGDVFLGEVDVGFDVGEDVDERGAEGFGFAPDGTGELFVGGADGEGALGVDEVHDGLGLGEVHFAVEEGALGEFAGFGRAGTGFEEGFEDALGDEQAAVALEFDGMFAGVAGGVVEEDGDALVEGQVVVVAGFDEVDSARGESVERVAMVQDPGTDFEGLWA